MSRLWLAFALLLGCLTWQRPASAQSPSRWLIVLTSESSGRPPFPAVLEATRGQLAELGVLPNVEPRAAPDDLAALSSQVRQLVKRSGALAAAWLTPEAGLVSVYFYEPVRDRVLVRRLALSESPAAAAEEVAIVLRSAVSAVLEGAAISMTELPPPPLPPLPPKPPPLPPPAPPAPKSDRPAWVELGAGYVGSYPASAIGFHQGAKTFASVPLGPLRLGLGYSWLPRIAIDTAALQVRLTRHPAELWLNELHRLGPLELGPEVALMLDAISRRTLAASAPLEATPRSTRWLWAIATRARLELPVRGGFGLFAAAGAEFALNPFAQEVQSQQEPERIIRWLRVRPAVEIGLLFSFGAQ